MSSGVLFFIHQGRQKHALPVGESHQGAILQPIDEDGGEKNNERIQQLSDHITQDYAHGDFSWHKIAEKISSNCYHNAQ